ncbi:hypothetical protein [Shewanella maritima]|uniref:hypothetical protein n=1 Tax=Shewanella maritima TaxID=2520507 RepID=UPI0037362516
MKNMTNTTQLPTFKQLTLTMSLFAAAFIALPSQAEGLTEAQIDQAVTKHWDILAEQQQQAENKLEQQQEDQFELALAKAEQGFVADICEQHDMKYDADSHICIE